MNNLKISSKNARPKVSIIPIKSAAKNAPFIDPMPPTMITTKAVMIMLFPIPNDASVIGAMSIPARPAKAAPMDEIPPASHQIIGKSIRYDVFMQS